MSSIPLTNSYFSRWLSHHQPDKITHVQYCSMVIFFSSFWVPQNGTDPRDPRCIADFAGGECADPNGSHSCTYHIEDAGPRKGPGRAQSDWRTCWMTVGLRCLVEKKKKVWNVAVYSSQNALPWIWIYIYITDLSGIDFEWIEIGSVTLDELSGRDNSWLGRANAKPWKSCVSCISH